MLKSFIDFSKCNISKLLLSSRSCSQIHWMQWIFFPLYFGHCSSYAEQKQRILIASLPGNDTVSFLFPLSFSSDHQKLEREARICRLLKHPNIGESFSEPTDEWIGGAAVLILNIRKRCLDIFIHYNRFPFICLRLGDQRATKSVPLCSHINWNCSYFLIVWGLTDSIVVGYV